MKKRTEKGRRQRTEKSCERWVENEIWKITYNNYWKSKIFDAYLFFFFSLSRRNQKRRNDRISSILIPQQISFLPILPTLLPIDQQPSTVSKLSKLLLPKNTDLRLLLRISFQDRSFQDPSPFFPRNFVEEETRKALDRRKCDEVADEIRQRMAKVEDGEVLRNSEWKMKYEKLRIIITEPKIFYTYLSFSLFRAEIRKGGMIEYLRY